MTSLKFQIAEKVAKVNEEWRIHLIGPLCDVRIHIQQKTVGLGHRVLTHKSASDFLCSERMMEVLVVDLPMAFEHEQEIFSFNEQTLDQQVVYVVDEKIACLALRLLQNGSVNFLIRPFTFKSMMKALMDAAKQVCSHHIKINVKRWQEANWNALTPREKVVGKHLMDGCGNTEIAKVLDIRPDTVKKHRASIFEKLHAASVSELVYAFKCFDFSSGTTMECTPPVTDSACPVRCGAGLLTSGSNA